MTGVRPVPTFEGVRVTLRPPASGDADAARRLGPYPEIARLFGEDREVPWREFTEDEARDLNASLGPSADRIDWAVDAGSGRIGTAALHSFEDADRWSAASSSSSLRSS